MLEINKSYIIIALIVIIVLAGYSVFSNLNSNKKIKDLRQEIEYTTDSLGTIQMKFSSLIEEYDSVVSELEITQNKIGSLRDDINTIMSKNIVGVNQVKSTLKDVLDKHEVLDSLSIVKSKPIFE